MYSSVCEQLVTCDQSGEGKPNIGYCIQVNFNSDAGNENISGNRCFKISCKIPFLAVKCNFFHDISRLDLVDDLLPGCDPAKTGMHPIQVRGMGATMTNEKLGTARVGSPVCHRHHAPVVVLFFTLGFTGNTVARATGTRSLRASALNHKSRYYPVKGQSVIKTLADQLFEIGYRSRRIIII